MGYAFLLLKFRLRSEHEIYQRLKKKKFTEEIINQTVTFLKQKGFINDSLFASAWIESRLKKPLGARRIRQELNAKGVSEEIIDKELKEAKENYSEPEIITNLARMRIVKLKGASPADIKRRLYAYLLRRGFSPEAVMDVVSRLCKQTY